MIDTEDEGSVGWGKVKADNIAYLVYKERIVREFERLAAMGLQAERDPHPADGGVGKPCFRRHRAYRPVRCIDRRRPQRPLDHSSNLIVVDSSRPTRAALVQQTIAAILQKSATPLANRVFVQAELRSHLLACYAFSTSQNDAASLR